MGPSRFNSMLSVSSMNKRVYSRAGVQMKLFPNSRTGNINSIATIEKIDQQKNMFEATRYFFRKLTKLSVIQRLSIVRIITPTARSSTTSSR